LRVDEARRLERDLVLGRTAAEDEAYVEHDG
jgi:hypothetical protein